MKGLPQKVRLDGDVETEVQEISKRTGLSQVEVIRQTVAAGVRAIKENSYRMSLPLILKVAEQPDSSEPSSAASSSGHARRKLERTADIDRRIAEAVKPPSPPRK